MKLKKRLFLFCIAIVGLMTMIGCKKSSDSDDITSEDYVMKIGYASGLCHAPLHIAQEKGFFEEEGLKVEMIKVSGAQTADALATGQIDASFGLVGKFIQPLENGLPMKITSGIHTGCTKLVVPQDSSIDSVADLKGKKIGVVSLVDAPCVTTKRALADEGIGVTSDNMEVEFVIYTSADLPIALMNGAIDAYADSDPAVSIAEKEYDLKAIINTTTDEKFKDEYCCVSFVSNELAEKNPELAAKYTRAVQEAALWIEENSMEAAKIQIEKEYVAGEPELNGEILESYNYIPSGAGGYEALKLAVYDLQEIGLIKETTDADELIENSYIKLDGVVD